MLRQVPAHHHRIQDQEWRGAHHRHPCPAVQGKVTGPQPRLHFLLTANGLTAKSYFLPKWILAVSCEPSTDFWPHARPVLRIQSQFVRRQQVEGTDRHIPQHREGDDGHPDEGKEPGPVAPRPQLLPPERRPNPVPPPPNPAH